MIADEHAQPLLLATDRLRLRELGDDDAAFIVRLLNEPSFLRYIGDKKVRTDADALVYIAAQVAAYRGNGAGLYLVLDADGTPIGLCGLSFKPWLDAPDLGYAFVPESCGHGYAVEAASAMMTHCRDTLGLTRVVAVVTPDNAASIRLLGKLGFRSAGTLLAPGGTEPLGLYEWRAAPVPRSTPGGTP